jgi:hypothetical protein
MAYKLLFYKENFGGRTRTRTLDPLIKSQLLCQLSYAPRQSEALDTAFRADLQEADDAIEDS